MPVTFHHDSGKGRSDFRVLEITLGGFQRTPRLFDSPFLDLDQQLQLADLVVADLGEVDTCRAFSADFWADSNVRRATSIWVKEATALASGPGSGRPGRGPSRETPSSAVALERAGPLLFESGKACVF